MVVATLYNLFPFIFVHAVCHRKTSMQADDLPPKHSANSIRMSQKLTDTPALPATTGFSEKIPLSNSGHHFVLFTSIEDLTADWEKVQPDNIFLQRTYLEILESRPPRGMQFTYLVFYKDSIPTGIAYCQISNFRPDKSIRDLSVKDKYPCIIRAFARYFKNFVVSKFDHNLLVCGNLLLTGEHGYYFAPGHVDKATRFRLLEEALILTQKHWEDKGLAVDGILIKDVQGDHRAPSRIFMEKKFREFTFHPNMVMALRPEWATFDDYLKEVTSKYRVRAKRAFKRAARLEKRELTEQQISGNKERLYELYKNVMDNASFNMVVLHEDYLPSLKKELGERFRIFGYYMDGELAGYYSTILNHHELEAHFLGFEPTFNKDCQIYLNMLYDILRDGIGQGVSRVVYARTAMEIKSSIGAEPFDMYCYIRSNNTITNKILPPLLEYLRPPGDWVPRKPFKEV
jgi:GNAT acetyltransferase-like protein